MIAGNVGPLLRKRRRGFGIIETVLVLAVGLGLIGGGVTYYSYTDYKAQYRDLNMSGYGIIGQVTAFASSHSNLPIGDLAELSDFRLPGFAKDGDHFIHSWADKVTLRHAGKYVVEFRLDNMPARACSQLAADALENWKGSYRGYLTIDGTVYENAGSSSAASRVDQVCSDPSGHDIGLTFAYNFSDIADVTSLEISASDPGDGTGTPPVSPGSGGTTPVTPGGPGVGAGDLDPIEPTPTDPPDPVGPNPDPEPVTPAPADPVTPDPVDVTPTPEPEAPVDDGNGTGPDITGGEAGSGSGGTGGGSDPSDDDGTPVAGGGDGSGGGSGTGTITPIEEKQLKYIVLPSQMIGQTLLETGHVGTFTTHWINSNQTTGLIPGDPVTIRGDSNPNMDLGNGVRGTSGTVSPNGTNVVMQVPACGATTTVYFMVGDHTEVSFSISRKPKEEYWMPHDNCQGPTK